MEDGFIAVIVPAETIQQFLFRLFPTVGDTTPFGIVQEFGNDDVEIATGLTEEDHAPVDSCAVLTVPELVGGGGDGDVERDLVEDVVQVGEDVGIGIEDEHARVEIECPGMHFVEGFEPVGVGCGHLFGFLDGCECLPGDGDEVI